MSYKWIWYFALIGASIGLSVALHNVTELQLFCAYTLSGFSTGLVFGVFWYGVVNFARE